MCGTRFKTLKFRRCAVNNGKQNVFQRPSRLKTRLASLISMETRSSRYPRPAAPVKPPRVIPPRAKVDLWPIFEQDAKLNEDIVFPSDVLLELASTLVSEGRRRTLVRLAATSKET